MQKTQKTSSNYDGKALRATAARVHGPFCAYCHVPTMATVEHVEARNEGGTSWIENIVLACPFCNSKKGKREVKEFVASGDWKMPRPPLPDNVPQMLKEQFLIDWPVERVQTMSPNSRIEFSGGEVILAIRPGRGKGYEWKRIAIGPMDSPKVTVAAYDFLARHFMPRDGKPPRRPPSWERVLERDDARERQRRGQTPGEPERG